MNIDLFINQASKIKEINPSLNLNINWDSLSVLEKEYEKEFLSNCLSTKEKELLESIKYIRAFCRNFPVFNGDDFQPLYAPFAYLKRRDEFLKGIPFTEHEFYHFGPIQETIQDLGLDPQPTFEFITFLYHSVQDQNTLNLVTCGSLLEEILERFNQKPDSKLKMTISVNGKRYDFKNKIFICSLLHTYIDNNYNGLELTETNEKRTRERTIQYSIIKSLLDYLPIKAKKPQTVKYVQAERTFSLSVLYLCKLLMGDPDIVCSKENNATFDKLMRDFENTKIDFTNDLI